jgi:hypothetical protein
VAHCLPTEDPAAKQVCNITNVASSVSASLLTQLAVLLAQLADPTTCLLNCLLLQ